MSGLFHDVNTIEEGKDWIAPRFAVYNEHAKVKTADGNVIDGGLYVEYCELCRPILAKCCAKELYRMDRFQSFFRSLELLDTPKLDADYAVAYRNETHFPTVIIQRGRVAVRAYFFQTSDYVLSLDEWSRIICDSIRN